jgi:hypothetical protein
MKGFESALNAQVLDLIHHISAAIITTAGQALGVFVGQARSKSLHHCLGSEVLRDESGLRFPIEIR